MLGYIVGALALAGTRKPSRSRLGQYRQPARVIEEWNSPKTSRERLWELAQGEDPRALMNPNIFSVFMSFDREDPPLYLGIFSHFCDVAEDYPQYVQQNPALALLYERNSIAYKSLMERINQGWIKTAEDKLPKREIDRLRYLFASHVAQYYEGEDNLANRILAAVEAYYDGESDFDEVQKLLGVAIKKREKQYLDSQRGRIEESYASRQALDAVIAAAQGEIRYVVESALHAVFEFAATQSHWGANVERDKELHWQADQIRAAYTKHLGEEARRKEIFDATMREIESNRFRESFYGEEATRSWFRRKKTEDDIKKAVEKAKADAKETADLMASEEPTNWPLWIGLGIGAAGVALLIGPEIVAALAARATIGYAAEVGATYAAEILSIARTSNVARAALSAEEIEAALISLGEATEARIAFRAMVNEIRAGGVKVVEEVVVRVVP